MGLGLTVRMNRLFAHPSRRLCSVAVDHFFNYQSQMPAGLADMPRTLGEIVAGGPDALTMQKGVALHCWREFAGRVPFILQSYLGRIDEAVDDLMATPEDAARMGADAYATVAFVRGQTEVRHLARVSQVLRQCHELEIPLVLHIYPRRLAADGSANISHAAEDVAWAVRCAMEVGVDLIKVPYTGDPVSYRQAIEKVPVPVVAAGGPKAETVADALAMAAGVVAAGARGMTVGRNVWGFANVTRIVQAMARVLHENVPPGEAMRSAGL